MEIIEIFILAGAVAILLVFWIAVGMRHLKQLQDGVRKEWEIIHDAFRTRADLIPSLIETIRIYDQGQENLIEEIIQVRALATKEYFPGAKKIELEYDISKLINSLVDFGKSSSGLGKDTNFLELKKEIEDLEKNIETRSKTYNEMVRYFNEHRKFPLLAPIALLFNYRHLDVFEFEL